MAAHEGPQAETVGPFRCELGESPLWHPQQRCLFWLDCPAGQLHRWDPATRAHEIFTCGGALGALVQGDDGALLLLGTEGRTWIWQSGQLSSAGHGTPEQRGYGFNDACVDRKGRVLCGVRAMKRAPTTPSVLQRVRRKLNRMLRGDRLDPALGLYRLGEHNRLSQLVSGIGLSNGLAFSPDDRLLYHADSHARRIVRYAYDFSDGSLGERTIFASFDPGEGTPDGVTVDRDGGVWTALWGGGAILHFDASGRLERRLPVPARHVTSLAFGDDDYGTLYVTTAADPDDTTGYAGAVIVVRPGVHGRAEHTTPLTRQLAWHGER